MQSGQVYLYVTHSNNYQCGKQGLLVWCSAAMRDTHLICQRAAVCSALVYCGKAVQEVDPGNTDMTETYGSIVNTIQANLAAQHPKLLSP